MKVTGASWSRFAERDLLLVLVWALGLRLAFAAITADTFDPDEFVILALSKNFAHGAIPYRDFVFFHPPGVLVLFRLLHPLVNWWWPAARVFTLIVDVFTAGFVWHLGRHLYGRQEALAAGILYGASPLALVSSVRVGQDPLITALGMAGLVCLVSTRSFRGSLVAGTCLGLAVWIKYPAVLFLPVYLFAAPRRAHVWLISFAAVSALAFVPFLPELRALDHQTVVWQTAGRRPTDLLQRIGATDVFWLALNPLSVVAPLLEHSPLWLLTGFGMGGMFIFAPQVYYHYFVPIVPFASLLAGPMVVRLLRISLARVVILTASLSLLWATDIAYGNPMSRLFVSASRFSAISPAVRLLDRTTSPGERVLTDQFEYTYLAQRSPVANYFWNVRDLVSAGVLEARLPKIDAVVLTEQVAPTYPRGFTDYLEDRRYAQIRFHVAAIWLLHSQRRAPAQGVGDVLAADQIAPQHFP